MWSWAGLRSSRSGCRERSSPELEPPPKVKGPANRALRTEPSQPRARARAMKPCRALSAAGAGADHEGVESELRDLEPKILLVPEAPIRIVGLLPLGILGCKVVIE